MALVVLALVVLILYFRIKKGNKTSWNSRYGRITYKTDSDGTSYRLYKNSSSAGIHPDDRDRVIRSRMKSFYEQWDACNTKGYNDGSHICPLCRSRTEWTAKGLTATCSCGHKENFTVSFPC